MKQTLIAFLAIFAATPSVAQQHEGHGTPPKSVATPGARADSAYGSHKAWQETTQRSWRESNAAVATPATTGAAGHQHGAATPTAATPSPSAAHDHGDMKAHMEKMKAGMKGGMKGDMKSDMKGDMKARHEAMHQRMHVMPGGTTATPAQPGKSDGAHQH